MVPPLTPGMILATPMKIPLIISITNVIMSIPLFYYIAAESARFIIGERDMPVKKTFIVVILGVFEKISVIFGGSMLN